VSHGPNPFMTFFTLLWPTLLDIHISYLTYITHSWHLNVYLYCFWKYISIAVIIVNQMPLTLTVGLLVIAFEVLDIKAFIRSMCLPRINIVKPEHIAFPFYLELWPQTRTCEIIDIQLYLIKQILLEIPFSWNHHFQPNDLDIWYSILKP